ncbi:hypothetical protein ACFCWM_34945, partial [Streptomyces noursei]
MPSATAPQRVHTVPSEVNSACCCVFWSTIRRYPRKIDRLGTSVPCRTYDPEVFFAESPADVEYAKT